MQFTEDLDQAAAYAKSSLEMMAKQRIAANPLNFSVWYGYFSGRDPELARALDALLSDGAEFTDERIRELYEKYIGADQERAEIREASSRLQSAVGEILGHLGAAGKEQSAYGEMLAGFGDKLSAGGESADVAALVEGVLSETRAIVEKNQALESRLGESSQEIDELRQHLEEVQREAMTDGLTAIANRKHFEIHLRQAAKDAMESGGDVCVLLADIDHFKKFNDTHGHRVGDEVLRVVARALQDGVKGRDTAARYGGEEFAVLLPQTSLKDAVTVADQIRRTLGSRALKNRKTGKNFGTVTLSIGVARLRAGEPLESLMQRADEALYRAKHDGRNRVVDETAVAAKIGLAG
jgi:diguanylate cyclase